MHKEMPNLLDTFSICTNVVLISKDLLTEKAIVTFYWKLPCPIIQLSIVLLFNFQ